MKNIIYIECAIKTKQPFNFATPVYGYNDFQIDIWESKIFEVKFDTGRRQCRLEIIDDAVAALKKVYGTKNISVRNVFDGFAEKEEKRFI